MKTSKSAFNTPVIIAIDGPAGVGKSSAGEKVASRLGYKFLSTGKMYRALAWKSVVQGIPVTDEKKVLELAKKIKWEFRKTKKTSIKMLVDGRIVDKNLYDEFVGKHTSIIARFVSVRKFMCKMQRALGRGNHNVVSPPPSENRHRRGTHCVPPYHWDGFRKGCPGGYRGIVMEGRDIGTNVFPDARIKIYMDASSQERAKRRVQQLAKQNLKADYGKILSAIQNRDKQDAERKANPLQKAEKSYYIDTTNLTLKDVVDRIIEFSRKLITDG